MDARKGIGYKTCITRWLLTIALSIAVFSIISPATLSSFQPQRSNTEAFWQVSNRHLRIVVVYGHKTCSAAPAQNRSAIFPPETPIFYSGNELIKIKFQHQGKLYASLKTTLQLYSIGSNPQNSEQVPLLG
jgi:hypothetical protein